MGASVRRGRRVAGEARELARYRVPQYWQRQLGGTLREQLVPLRELRVWRFSLYYVAVFGAYVALSVEQDAWREISSRVAAVRYVEHVSLVAAEFDVLVLVRAPDNETLRVVVLTELQSIPGVRSTRTWLVFADSPDRGHPDLNEEKLVGYAREAGVADIERFREDMTSDRYDEAIRADYEAATALGATSTPTFLINGTGIIGARSTETFRNVIDSSLDG